MVGFILGALTGGTIMWYWRDRIREFAEENMIGARKSAADTLRSFADAAEGAKERARSDHAGTSTFDPSGAPR